MTPVFDAAFRNYSHLVLAVSGGSDSTALMHLVMTWHRARLAPDVSKAPTRAPPSISVLTIDHALRPGSATDAVAVARAAGRLGVLPVTTLRWDGHKPRAGVQAAARAARFDLIRAHLSANGWPAVVMAHTADDQAETLLMRLGRGSGIDGLGAMRASVAIAPGQTLLRPLLGVPKSALTDYLRANGVAWSEDPSNQSGAFERVRWRTIQAKATAAGVGLNNIALARSAARAARASAALDALTAQLWRQRGDHARFDTLGTAALDWDWLLAQPEELRLRLLAGLIGVIGGKAGPVSLGQLEALTVGRGWLRPHGATLHGVQFDRSPGDRARHTWVRLMREAGRGPLPEQRLARGQTTHWDRRFRVALGPDCPAPLRLAALMPEGCQALKVSGWTAPPGVARALWTQPALRDDAGLVVVPTLGFVRRGFSGTVQCDAIVPWFCRPEGG